MPKLHDLTGKQFTRWTVVRFVSRINRRTKWLCRCECGAEREVLALTLTRTTRASRSCGCLAHEEASGRTSGLTHGKSGTREHRIWKGMRNRCLNPKGPDFDRYGGRGIRIDARWDLFDAFLTDMGLAPSAEHTLDRKNVNGDYCADNCRWATQTEQQRNRRNNKLDEGRAAEIRVAIAGGQSLQSVADRYNVSKKLINEIKQGRAWKPRLEQPSLFGRAL